MSGPARAKHGGMGDPRMPKRAVYASHGFTTDYDEDEAPLGRGLSLPLRARLARERLKIRESEGVGEEPNDNRWRHQAAEWGFDIPAHFSGRYFHVTDIVLDVPGNRIYVRGHTDREDAKFYLNRTPDPTNYEFSDLEYNSRLGF